MIKPFQIDPINKAMFRFHNRDLALQTVKHQHLPSLFNSQPGNHKGLKAKGRRKSVGALLSIYLH